VLGQLAQPRRVRGPGGARDEYLSPNLARHLAALFGHAELHVIDDASHWLQDDQSRRTDPPEGHLT
jgi:pimeloyl-ACP methyl ester carboxylesterase